MPYHHILWGKGRGKRKEKKKETLVSGPVPLPLPAWAKPSRCFVQTDGVLGYIQYSLLRGLQEA